MRLTVAGCAGSFPGPDSPASAYLVEADADGRTYQVVIDLGSGALGALQRHCDLRAVDAVAISHLHPDHCLDLCGYYVVRKYHPEGPLARLPVHAPAGAAAYLARAYGDVGADGMDEQFTFSDWSAGEPVTVGPITLTPMRVPHPVPAYALRVEAGGRTLVYTGDTGPHEPLVDFASGADLFLAEASFVQGEPHPPDLHLTGVEAGDYARRAGVGRLLVTHIPAWTEREAVAADVRRSYDGPFDLVRSGDVYTL